MKRRTLLRSFCAGLAALSPLPAALAQGVDRLSRLSADVGSMSHSEALWRRVRTEFEFGSGITHLNCGSLGATPRLVLDAVSSVHKQIETSPSMKLFGWGGEQMELARARAAAFIGAELDEVAFTRNTTEGMNAVAGGIDLQPGDQVLTTNHEHGGGMVCWQHARRHRGVEIVYLPMPTPVRDRSQILDLVREHITPRTRVCSFSHVDTITGVQMPIAEIAEITRPRDILLVCDGAQAPGMIPVDLAALGADTYALSGHKWLLAPKGSGLLYVRKEAQERVQPALLHSGYRAYTASSGTRDVASVLGLSMTMDFHDAIGRERVMERGRQLRAYLAGQLSELPGLRPLTPEEPGLSGLLQTWALESGNAGEIGRKLRDDFDIVVKTAQSTYAFSEEPGLSGESYNALRFSTHLFNSEAEIDRAVGALRALVRS